LFVRVDEANKDCCDVSVEVRRDLPERQEKAQIQALAEWIAKRHENRVDIAAPQTRQNVHIGEGGA
jgi:hypothetical protein